MPSLKYMGRRWGFGADDLVVPSLMCGILRIAWLVLSLLVAIKFHKVLDTCRDEDDEDDGLGDLVLKLFITTSIVVFVCVIIIYFVTFAVARRGTIVQVEKRKQMNCLLTIVNVSLVIELFNTFVGTFILADHDLFAKDTFTPCSSNKVKDQLYYLIEPALSSASSSSLSPVEDQSQQLISESDLYHLSQTQDDANFSSRFVVSEIYSINANDEPWIWLRLVVIGSWIDIMLTFSCWGFACFFSSKLDPRHYDYEQGIAIPLISAPSSRPFEATATVWAGRCQSFCLWFQCATCNLFGGTTGTGGPTAFQEVAIVMASFFKGLDLVPSDIVAALFLLRAQQREDEAAAVRAIIRQRIAQEQPPRTRERRQIAGNGMFVSVSRWMWASSGVGARAQSKIHAQQTRTSRLARGTSGDLDPEASKLLEHASYLCPYMLSIYGWMLFSYMHGIKGWCNVCAKSKNPCLRCCSYCYCCCVDAIDEDEDIQRRPAIIGNTSSDNNGCLNLDFMILNYKTRHTNPQADIVYASFTSYSGRAVPYCISVDHAHKKVVISVRGSLSLADAITDALMIPENLQRHAEKWGFREDAPDGSYAHAGMLRVAAWIREDIERHQVLHKLLGVKGTPISGRNSASSLGGFTSSSPKNMSLGQVRSFSGKPSLEVVMEEDEEEEEEENGRDEHKEKEPKSVSPLSSQESDGDRAQDNGYVNQQSNEDYDYDVDNGSYPRDRTYSMEYDSVPECSGYDLELVGHSLGAGVASILSLFLRPQFPSLKCIAFSPPGCIFDWKLANHSADWISSIFVGKDFAARCSWFSLVKIRGQILDVLRRAKVNKMNAFAASIITRDLEDLLYRENEVPDTPQTRALMQRIDELATTTVGRGSTTLDQVRMYIPGRVLHLVKEETTTWGGCGPCRREKRRYVPFWVDDRSTLDEILLSTRMALDHFPDFVDHVIHDIVTEYKLEGRR